MRAGGADLRAFFGWIARVPEGTGGPPHNRRAAHFERERARLLVMPELLPP
jgi:hypothetical protein